MAEHFTGLTGALKDRYRLERELGQGGMATVYLAHDLKHERGVAIKVLRPELAAVLGADRFVHEIRTTANLQHPNILPLFDSGEADGFLYYVMPYVEGESLRQKLNRETQLGIEDAVRIARDVAEALDYAHRRNVVHRDIKPENILLHDGRPMVLDFGIALAVSAAAGGRMTETGLSLGTPHYMSPEQATADKHITHRSDIYSLGSVLYEMLTGEPPHTGSSAQAIILKIVTDVVRPVTDLRKAVPRHVAAATAKALEKLPADRFESAKAFAEALANPAFTLPTPAAAAGSGVRPPIHRVSLALNGMLALGVITLAILAFGDRTMEGPAPSPWVTRTLLELDPSSLRSPPVLSPDGRQLAWSTAQGIHVRSLDQLLDRVIPGTEGGAGSFFSPDGQSLGFVLGSQVRVVPLAGGPHRALADTAATPVWAEDGWVYFSRYPRFTWSPGRHPPGTEILRVREAGGPVEQVLAPDSTRVFRPVAAITGGRGILGTVSEPAPTSFGVSEGEISIAVLNPETRATKILFSGQRPRYEPQTRHIVFLRRTTLLAVAYDPDRMEVVGQPFPVAEDVGGFGLADDGTLWSIVGPTRPRPVLVDRRGRAREIMPAPSERDEIVGAHFDPDGRRLVLELRVDGSPQADLWVYQFPDGPRIRLTDQGGDFPAWTPDGQFVLFTRDDGVYRVRADATAPAELVLQAEGIGWLQPVPGGGIVFERTNGRNLDVGTASLRGDDQVRMLVDGDANEEDPAVSPDGRWLAYESDESGRREVYVMPFGIAGRGRRISVAGGNNPSWSWSGDRLFFTNATRGFEAVRFRATSAFEVLGRTVLFQKPFDGGGRFPPGPGDSVFLAMRPGGPRPDARFILVRNWARELLARAEEARR